jgi:hypothetical protein
MVDFEYKGGEGLWQQWVDPETGKSSLEEHTLKTVWESCENNNHFFEIKDPRKREATCSKCGLIKFFVLGIQTIKNGEIVTLR